MAAKKTTTRQWTKVNIGQADVYIEEGDIREILDIVGPTTIVDENGEEHSRNAQIVVAGPKGGQLRISLPGQYWKTISTDVAIGNLCPGMGVDSIGWKRLFDKEGNPVLDENGFQKKTFYPNGCQPNFYK